MRIAPAVVFAVLIPALPAVSQEVIPHPARVTDRTGEFQITARTVIWTDRASASVGRQLALYLEPATGFTLRVATGGAVPPRAITLRQDASLKRLGAEGYSLEIRPGSVVARAPGNAGLFYAVQTIRQLLPPEVFREAAVTGVQWRMPALSIEDRPRFAWRGGHLDVARHFMPKEFVKKYIDLLALHKFNVFHWHLTEDQGWRIEIKQYPRLTEIGAWRKETLVGRKRKPGEAQYDGKRHGGFYTQEDAREIVAYAKARYINVIPEIEMPGHAMAAIAAYPELGVTGEPVEVATHWGVFSDILNAEPSTITFMQNILDEVMQIFPSRYIHIGGDEAEKSKWKASERIQARIKALGLKDEHELQSWFIREMDTFLVKRGRRLVGWDEILEGGLAENAVVMSWRGVKGGIEAARAKHDVVMAPTSHTYFDYAQSKAPGEPVSASSFLPLETVYSYEPIPAELEPQFATHVLGAQGQLWSEYMPTPKQVEYQAFPRMAALAEVVWSPKEVRDYRSFLGRLKDHEDRLRILDVNFRPLDRATVPQEATIRADCDPEFIDTTTCPFTFGQSRFDVSADGRLRKIAGPGAFSALQLPLPKTFRVEDIYSASIGNDMLLVYGISDGEVGAATAARIDLERQRVRWHLRVPGFNVSAGTIEADRLYQAAFGFVGAIDLTRGEFVWQHPGLYDRASQAFNAFDQPKVGPGEVVFIEDADTVTFRAPRTIRVDKRTGKIR